MRRRLFLAERVDDQLEDGAETLLVLLLDRRDTLIRQRRPRARADLVARGAAERDDLQEVGIRSGERLAVWLPLTLAILATHYLGMKHWAFAERR